MKSVLLSYQLLAGFLLFLLMACTSETPVPPVATGAVSFSAYTAQPLGQTRANDITAIPDGGSIGVYATYHSSTTWGEEYAYYLGLDPEEKQALNTLFVPDFMKNQQVTFDEASNAWTYSPLKYWPNTPTDKLSFMAYYPYNVNDTPARNALGFAMGFQDGMPYIAASIKKDNVTNSTKNQVDLLMSDLLADLPDGTMAVSPSATPDRHGLTVNDRVHFYFRHLLSKVSFRFIVQPDIRADVANLSVGSITMDNIYNNGNMFPSYNPATKETTFAWTLTENARNHKDSYTFQPNEAQLMLPQQLTREGSVDDPFATLTLTYTLTLRSYGTAYTYDASGNPVETPTYSYTRTATLPLHTLTLAGTETPLTEWLPNTHYVYNIRIGADHIGFDAEVVDWGDIREVVVPVE